MYETCNKAGIKTQEMNQPRKKSFRICVFAVSRTIVRIEIILTFTVFKVVSFLRTTAVVLYHVDTSNSPLSPLPHSFAAIAILGIVSTRISTVSALQVVLLTHSA